MPKPNWRRLRLGERMYLSKELVHNSLYGMKEVKCAANKISQRVVLGNERVFKAPLVGVAKLLVLDQGRKCRQRILRNVSVAEPFDSWRKHLIAYSSIPGEEYRNLIIYAMSVGPCLT